MKLNKNVSHYGVLAGLGLGFLLLSASTSQAMVGHCANCHTMHASQDGVALGVPTAQLLTSATCSGCHALGANTDPATNGPSVTGTTGNYLAGGTFSYVTANHATGHNVDELNLGKDLNMPDLAPPGDSSTTDWATVQLRCAGTNGCHGDRTVDDPMASIAGAHHGNSADAITATAASTVGGSFRFLKGISGFEDLDWEFTTATATDHNQYKGVDRSAGTDADVTDDTISALCAQCHGTFHNGANNISLANDMNSAWVRHPTDFDMGTAVVAGNDYDGYGGATNDYQLDAPVASTDISTQLGTVYGGAGDAIVTCISCHRAHGSEFADALRWDYDPLTSSIVVGAGAAGGGCLLCHTTK